MRAILKFTQEETRGCKNTIRRQVRVYLAFFHTNKVNTGH